ncbi:hypothetical protein [Stecheria intestinalis]|uniref:hypothetical protein n=1 Tax=Stecheria intestinalis TaxID=2606630 RepID=UPI0023F2C900|nr:hypothetical protein [Stecheria intestinalis]MDD5882055.1 hypothetical protein [Stecheria intestinalis]MDY4682648.1 hypothetical protein [Lachnospiraceae bacterium]
MTESEALVLSEMLWLLDWLAACSFWLEADAAKLWLAEVLAAAEPAERLRDLLLEADMLSAFKEEDSSEDFTAAEPEASKRD